MKRVVIIQRVLPHYRVAFFAQLRDRLRDLDIELVLIVGQPTRLGALKKDSATLDWAVTIENRYVSLGHHRHVVWQPARKHVVGADLIVVEQASRLLFNYLIMLRRRFGGPRVAFWGHGVNLDRARASRIGEAVKRWLSRRADWWFCYTEGTKQLMERLGVPVARMTVVQNAVDVSGLQRFLARVSDDQTRSLRASLGMGDGCVGLVLGSIYPSKRPQYLVQAADQIRRDIPDFQVVVVGDGPDRPLIDAAAVTRPWLHPVGMLTGEVLVEHAALASVLLNPGLVGLAVLDAFALRLPMITCDLELHSPEIEYLVDGFNGVIVARDATPSQFAAAVVRTCSDAGLLEALRAGCAESAERYSIEAMVDNFVSGVRGALGV